MAQSIFQDRIDSFNQQITDLNAEITIIDAETPTDQEIIDMLASRKAQLESRILEVTNSRDNFQTIIDNFIAKEALTFTTEQQTVVDSISTDFSGKYDNQMEKLRKDDSSKKTEFFDLYAKAENLVQKDCVIRHFFNL